MENKIICPKCGGELPLDSEFCQYCGEAVPQTDKDINEEIKNVSQPKQSAMSHTLMKGFMLIEDKEWKKAEKCFDNILNHDIKCSDAYIGKLLIELRLESKKDLLETCTNLEKNKNFIRAYKFANENQKNILNGIVIQNRINLKNKKQKQKKIKKRILIASLSIFITICIGIGGFFGYKNFLSPMIKYNNAKSLLDEGKYEEANEIFEKLNGYSDSNTQVNEAKYQLAKNHITKKQYKEAITILDALQNYNDSDKLLKETKYTYAVNLYNEKKYVDSAIYFSDIKDYKDSEIKYLYASAYASFSDEWYEKAGDYFNKLISKGENLENLKEYHFCVGINSNSIGTARNAFTKCGNYAPAKQALTNLKVIEKIQGNWHVEDCSTYLWEYTKITINGFNVKYESKYNNYTGDSFYNYAYRIISYYSSTPGHFGEKSNYGNERNVEKIFFDPITKVGETAQLITDENLIHYATNSKLEVLGDTFVR